MYQYKIVLGPQNLLWCSLFQFTAMLSVPLQILKWVYKIYWGPLVPIQFWPEPTEFIEALLAQYNFDQFLHI